MTLPTLNLFGLLRMVAAYVIVGLISSVSYAAFPAGTAVSPYIKGQNYWYNPPDSAYPVIRESGVKLIRIGGISYDTTPLANAELLKQVDNIRSIGAEPLIQVSRFKGAAIAAETVRYLNVTHNRAVKYWSIGNEPDMGWTGREADLATEVATYIKAIAPAMRDVDSTIHISGPEMAWYSQTKFYALLGGGGAADVTGRDSKDRFYIDCITFHRYPFADGLTRSAVLSEMHGEFETRVSELVDRIAYANILQGRTGASALTWGLTEFNMTYKNPATTLNNPAGVGVSSFLNGQFFAEYYRVGMKYGVQFMVPWSVLEGGGNGSPGDLGYLGGSWAAPVKRSSFYHMALMADYLVPGGYLSGTTNSANLAVLSTSSPTQNALSVMLLNEDTVGSQGFTLRLDQGTVLGAGTKINVAAGLAQEYSGMIENQTTLVLVFDMTGTLTRRITYSLARYELNQSPLVEVFTGTPTTPAPAPSGGGSGGGGGGGATSLWFCCLLGLPWLARRSFGRRGRSLLQ
jgi:hypothetical protein